MILIDANLLLYAYVPSFRQHKTAKAFIETTLANRTEIVALSWQVIPAFVRIGTNPRVFNKPFSLKDASERIDTLIPHPLVQSWFRPNNIGKSFHEC